MQLLKNNLFYYVIKSFRPKQWTKNFFVFAAILFSQNIFNIPMLIKVCIIFVVFSLLASSIYLINDVCDVEKDRKHPKKKNRPIASGKVPKWLAITIAIVMSLSCISISFYFGYYTGVVAIAYLVQAVFYSLYFKNIVIMDVLFIALGFLLRVVAGGVIIGVNISVWLLVCVTLLSLFMALCKRRHEMLLLGIDANSHRSILNDYSVSLLDQMISVVTSAILVFYSIYTFMANQNKYLMFTTPFVLYGIFRYLYLVYKKEGGGEPEEILLMDKPMILDLLLWVVVSYLALYVMPVML